MGDRSLQRRTGHWRLFNGLNTTCASAHSAIHGRRSSSSSSSSSSSKKSHNQEPATQWVQLCSHTSIRIGEAKLRLCEGIVKEEIAEEDFAFTRLLPTPQAIPIPYRPNSNVIARPPPFYTSLCRSQHTSSRLTYQYPQEVSPLFCRGAVPASRIRCVDRTTSHRETKPTQLPQQIGRIPHCSVQKMQQTCIVLCCKGKGPASAPTGLSTKRL